MACDWPAAQSTQADAPTPATLPASQTTHSFPPKSARPEMHVVHTSNPSSATVPGAQSTQMFVSPLTYEPGEHGVQATTPADDTCPTGHSTQGDADSLSWSCHPAAHATRLPLLPAQ